MKRVIGKVNRRTTVGVAAFLISASYLASRILGLLRDRLLAAHFGISPELDAYVAAFRLPELLFTLLVSGAFAVAFIPVLTEYWAKDKREEAWATASSLLNILMLTTLGIGIVCFIFADPLTRLIAPGFDQARHDLTVNLTRIMLITPFFFAISSVLGGIQQSFNRFFFYAIASVFYNVGIIFGIVALGGQYGIYGAAIGVVLGTIIQAMVQVFGLIGLGYRYRPVMNLRLKGVRQVLKLMVPRSIGQGIDQLNFTVQTTIGSTLAGGNLAAFSFAHNLKNVPVGIFAAAIATAAFPRLARSALGDRQRVLEDWVTNARLILFLVLPAATLAILMRGYIVRLLFGFGNQTTADALGWFAGAILFQSLFLLIVRVYYALKDTKTPLYVSILAIITNTILSLILVKPYGVSGLAMAQSLTAVVEVIILLAMMKQRLGTIGLRSLMRGVLPMLVANSIMAGAVYLLVTQFLPLYLFDQGFGIIASKFAVLAAAALLAYLLPCYLLGLKEAHMVIEKLKTHILRPLNLV